MVCLYGVRPQEQAKQTYADAVGSWQEERKDNERQCTRYCAQIVSLKEALRDQKVLAQQRGCWEREAEREEREEGAIPPVAETFTGGAVESPKRAASAIMPLNDLPSPAPFYPDPRAKKSTLRLGGLGQGQGETSPSPERQEETDMPPNTALGATHRRGSMSTPMGEDELAEAKRELREKARREKDVASGRIPTANPKANPKEKRLGSPPPAPKPIDPLRRKDLLGTGIADEAALERMEKWNSVKIEKAEPLAAGAGISAHAVGETAGDRAKRRREQLKASMPPKSDFNESMLSKWK